MKVAYFFNISCIFLKTIFISKTSATFCVYACDKAGLLDIRTKRALEALKLTKNVFLCIGQTE